LLLLLTAGNGTWEKFSAAQRFRQISEALLPCREATGMVLGPELASMTQIL
jgi:hypothetical protein